MGKPKNILGFLLCMLTCVAIGTAQSVRCSAEDRAEFESRQVSVRNLDALDPGTTIVAIGTMFLGTPYVAHTLESEDREQLVVTFQGLDCTTFVENVLAFYRIHRKANYSFDDFARELQHIRYRGGELKGYPSRLHYFTEWIADNEKKGLLKDITAELGGKEIAKNRNFMSRHRDAYSALHDEIAYQGILEMEAALAGSTYSVLSIEALIKAEPAIRNGDIVAFATSIDGLDVTHTGMAIWQGDRVHLLHASSSGRVEISSLPLADYAKKISKNNGLIIARISD